MPPVITSLLDTDLYKYTMWQAMLHRHPETQAEYTFVCRNAPAYPLAELVPEIDRELDALSGRCASSAPTSSTSCASSTSSATSSLRAPRPTAKGSRSLPVGRRCT